MRFLAFFYALSRFFLCAFSLFFMRFLAFFYALSRFLCALSRWLSVLWRFGVIGGQKKSRRLAGFFSAVKRPDYLILASL
jgi:hypothetical protein